MNIPNNLVEIRKIFSNLLSSTTLQIISFINPEIFLESQKNKELEDFLSTSKYNFIDGIGLIYLINKYFNYSFNSSNRFAGTDFFNYLDPDNDYNIFLLGAKIENTQKAKKEIEEKHPNIKIVGLIDGYSNLSDDKKVTYINSTKPDILIVCLGNPLQEKWIEENKHFLNVKLVFGNGGAIDFWSKAKRRAPDFLIDLNLEWLYRLFQDFNLVRIKRQLKLFPFLIKLLLRKYKVEEL